uniref:Putative secreted protein n=1 Tax=Anopheles darlingi TaxID=43151 RepID=A0A2M4DGI9_ANODA
MNLWFSMLLPWLPPLPATEFCERCVLRKEIVNLSRFRLASPPDASSLSPPPPATGIVGPPTPTPSALPPFFSSVVSPMNPGPSSDW